MSNIYSTLRRLASTTAHRLLGRMAKTQAQYPADGLASSPGVMQLTTHQWPALFPVGMRIRLGGSGCGQLVGGVQYPTLGLPAPRQGQLLYASGSGRLGIGNVETAPTP